MPPRLTEYERRLDAPGINWMRLRFVTMQGNVIDVTVQNETVVDGRLTPVARYDTHHDRPHLDMLYHDGRQEKRWINEAPPYNGIMQEAVDDFISNWPTDLRAHFRGHL